MFEGSNLQDKFYYKTNIYNPSSNFLLVSDSLLNFFVNFHKIDKATTKVLLKNTRDLTYRVERKCVFYLLENR